MMAKMTSPSCQLSSEKNTSDMTIASESYETSPMAAACASRNRPG